MFKKLIPCTTPVAMETKIMAELELSLTVINSTAQRFDIEREIIIIQNKRAVMVFYNHLIKFI